MAFAAWRRRSRSVPQEQERVKELVNEAVGLELAGRIGAAVDACRHAVEELRQLARRDRGAALPMLALAHRNLSEFLSSAGRAAEAVAAAEDAVRTARELYAIDRWQHEEMLVKALAIHSKRLVSAGRPAEALVPAREALALSDEPADALLARILEAYAIALAATGQEAEALAVSGRGLTVRRRLAADQPVGSTPQNELAHALGLHANRLYRAGRWRECVETSAESVARFRESARTDDELPRALRNYAVHLAGVRRPEEALAAAEESVGLARDLVEVEPAHRNLLATSLRAYAGRLSELGRGAEATAADSESVEIYRELAAGDRSAYLAELAEAIAGLGAVTEDDETSLALTEEAVMLLRELAAGDRAAHVRDLALGLSNLARRLAANGRVEEALAAGMEALDLEREAATSNRPSIVSRHARTLGWVAARLDEAGRVDEARAYGAQAVAVAREALAANRAANRGILAAALEDQAARLMGPRRGAKRATARPRDRNKPGSPQAMWREAQRLWAEDDD
ncbi:tetratricopeptide repeat protein [Asanoa sp. WMMD1127]|uniref:tetratricopeptide repeat protein n=1 Tax=Asanoa sp. WMMD1127 TaxID=3016107 RepID=UPI002415C713|nr:tetratricopeptide repeat protein [Asanoa sp. WMMD1127]MDG4826925.1 tetratricopeptide repeat protein [Asanoa sp. WMMD1127]